MMMMMMMIIIIIIIIIITIRLYSFFASPLDGGERSASGPSRFSPGKGYRMPLNRRPRGPQSQSGHCKVEKSLFALENFEPRITQTVANRFTD
jgi:hypothetical protein